MSAHTENKLHQCSFCLKDFTRHGNLLKHMKTHTGERPYQCSVCLKDFACHQTLSRHLRVHASDEPSQSPQSVNDLTNKSNLLKPARVCKGKKLYPSSGSQRRLPRKIVLGSGKKVVNQTKKLPVKEKRYQCLECEKDFLQHVGLLKHMRVHIEKTLSQRTVCEKQNSNVKDVCQDEVNTADKLYQCSECPREFTRYANLVKHMRLHTGEKPYKCSMCSYQFPLYVHLIKHLKVHIGEEQTQCLETVEVAADELH
ncbi:hypothetical protein OTU49_009847 [Cherax quadricarinatus]|uniref:C2H2-type domain-containing protein n=1 Tax=Cherax quadricarinatus TaxID=27406 RepID=A0AAW0WJY8_CHEQU|nr:zinc finger protein 271-like [Cherax quadricarinatus]XP_053654387.1 zinc finger protein 271-like [Cherax quadricarinatus]